MADLDLLTQRLGVLAHNAERAMAIPRESVWEDRLAQCEELIDRIKYVVLDMCEYHGLPPEGLSPIPLRPRIEPLGPLLDPCVTIFYPRHRERAVGPDDPADDLPWMMGEVAIQQPVPEDLDPPVIKLYLLASHLRQQPTAGPSNHSAALELPPADIPNHTVTDPAALVPNDDQPAAAAIMFPPAPTPDVHLISATPVNSQDAAADPVQLPPTPPDVEPAEPMPVDIPVADPMPVDSPAADCQPPSRNVQDPVEVDEPTANVPVGRLLIWPRSMSRGTCPHRQVQPSDFSCLWVWVTRPSR